MHRLAPAAVADLDDIVAYLAEHGISFSAAERLISTITERFHTLTQYPYLGRPRDDFGSGRRSSLVGEYVIVYRVDDPDVVVLRVLHGRRDLEALLQ